MMFLQMSALYSRCSTNDCAARTAMPKGRSAVLDLRLASRLLRGTAGRMGRPRATCSSAARASVYQQFCKLKALLRARAKADYHQ